MRSILFTLVLSLAPFSSFAINTIDITVILIPEKPCIEIANEMNKQIVSILKVEDNPRGIWGIPIYEAEIDSSNLNDLDRELKLVKIPNFSVMLSKVQNISNDLVSYNILKNPKVRSIHELITHILIQYKTGPIKKIKDSYRKLSDEKRILIDKYGTYNVLENYKQHLPFFFSIDTNPALEDATNELLESAPTDILCKINEIAIAELGYHGNIEKILKSRPL
jgi:hypothetical protein